MALRSEIAHFISTTIPGKQFIRGSKMVRLPGFKGFSIYDIWSPFIQQLRKTSLVERASGISFNIVMAIPPTLIFVFTLIPYLPISKQFIHQIFALIRDIVPGEKNNSVIIKFLNDFISKPRNGLLIKSFKNLKIAELFFSRSEEHTSELQSRPHLVCRLLLEKKKKI